MRVKLLALIVIALAISSRSLPVIELHQAYYQLGELSHATVVVRSDSNEDYHVRVKLIGAKLESGGNSIEFARKVKSGEAIRIDLNFVPREPVTRIRLEVNSVKAEGLLGKVPVPGALAEYEIREKVISIGLWNPLSKAVRFVVSFNAANPVKEVVEKKCIERGTAYSTYYYCLKKTCAVPFYGNLNCTKWETVEEVNYSCIEWRDGGCTKYLVVPIRLNKCVEMVAGPGCLLWTCAKWKVEREPVEFCKVEVTEVRKLWPSYALWSGEVEGFAELKVPFEYKEGSLEAGGNEVTLFSVYADGELVLEARESAFPDIIPFIETLILYAFSFYFLWRSTHG
ncbi:hypothetical protein EYM_05995 [Ignicoccus islandicus DSM 13165]|uniref:Uncharacterized protein n=1 Tax=Ignicoccus islandicus DSM 13165 TaxID=940295 RepID=A0A0U3FT69_9CREN|nr:hypothetical protein [Ignicoccus islandicus]ALU12640.1 hypothetical protein EYM_05995 [Ignicoccus islandicus DSM 13165]